MKIGRSAMDNEQGLTLVELMVVLAILAVVAGLAAPSFTRDDNESKFRHYVIRMARDMRRARIEALSSREDRSVFIHTGPPMSYTLEAAVPNQPTTSLIIKPQVAPNGVQVVGVLPMAAEPGSGVTGTAVLPAEVRFTGINQVMRLTGAQVGTLPPVPGSATVLFQTTDGRHRARIVVFGATGHANVHFDG